MDCFNIRFNSRLTLSVSLFSLSFLAFSISAQAKPVLANLEFLKEAGIDSIVSDESIQVGFADLTEAQEEKLSQITHSHGRCAGFSALDESFSSLSQSELKTAKTASNVKSLIEDLKQIEKENADSTEVYEQQAMSQTKSLKAPRPFNPAIADAIKRVKPDSIHNWIQWLSSFKTRYCLSSTPNEHVEQLKGRLQNLSRFFKQRRVPVDVTLISHRPTPQKSIRVRIKGKTRPNEVVVLGGHLDSINQWGGDAPGADDNASGSAALLEALRVILEFGEPERTIDFFWYAGEEKGLWGSAEIAKTYRNSNVDVIGVLQLDMTGFKGDGANVIGSMTDFTHGWLRAKLGQWNQTYLGIKVIDDKCGYGCSDHASWHQNRYPALMPFESTFHSMNHAIHSEKDTLGLITDEHAALFAKIAVIFAMDLGNSTERAPASRIARF